MDKPDFSKLTPDNITAFLADIFERRGGEEYLGEPVTMAEHMLQGAHFAEQAQEPEDRLHEEAGAEVLEAFFPKLVTDCVHHHVSAKRYLCAVKPEYYNRLSKASIHSLNLQGGR